MRGKLAVMLTYHWQPVVEAPEPLLLRVVFQYAGAHPPAPAEIQAIINELDFVEAS